MHYECSARRVPTLRISANIESLSEGLRGLLILISHSLERLLQNSKLKIQNYLRGGPIANPERPSKGMEGAASA